MVSPGKHQPALRFRKVHIKRGASRILLNHQPLFAINYCLRRIDGSRVCIVSLFNSEEDAGSNESIKDVSYLQSKLDRALILPYGDIFHEIKYIAHFTPVSKRGICNGGILVIRCVNLAISDKSVGPAECVLLVNFTGRAK